VTSKKTNPQMRLAITSARWKAASAIYCAAVLRPDLDEKGKHKLASAILSLGDNQDRTVPRRPDWYGSASSGAGPLVKRSLRWLFVETHRKYGAPQHTQEKRQ
jgi:hypothetical protein